MTHSKYRLARLSVTVAAVLALSACGGGRGGGGGLPGVAPAASTTTPPPPSQNTTAPSASAPPGLEELAATTLLNSERQACGFAPLARNAQLDAAARGHAHWNLVNNSTGHYQTPDTLDFTGINETDRASAAGYKPGVVEDSNTDSFGRSKATGFGELAIHSLLTAPYHLRSMVGNFRDVGIAVLTSDDTGTTGEFGPRVTAQLELGYTLTDGPRNPAPGAVLSYPCGGTTGTFARLANESPNPVPYRDLATSPLGQPIYLVGDEGKTLAVTSALVQEVATGNTVALLPTLTAANDPNFYIRSSEAIVIPDAPLKTNTQYRVTIVGTNDGISFTKTFNFTTGALADATDASL